MKDCRMCEGVSYVLRACQLGEGAVAASLHGCMAAWLMAAGGTHRTRLAQ